jgi:hypothetical protein
MKNNYLQNRIENYESLKAEGKITVGEDKILFDYYNRNYKNIEYLICGDMWQSRDKQIFKDYVKTLIQANINQFVINDRFSGLIDILWELQENNCSIEKVIEIKIIGDKYTDDTIIHGLLINIKG